MAGYETINENSESKKHYFCLQNVRELTQDFRFQTRLLPKKTATCAADATPLVWKAQSTRWSDTCCMQISLFGTLSNMDPLGLRLN